MKETEINILFEQLGIIANKVDSIDTTLNTIKEYLELFSMILQISFYGVLVLLIIYFGYWFFSRFFY